MKRISLILLYVALSLLCLVSGPGGARYPKSLEPQFLERGAPELGALVEIRPVQGQDVYVPVPPATMAAALAGSAEPWKLALLAQVNERLGRFPEAETAWKDYAAKTPAPADGASVLADYYHRRRMYGDEIRILEALAPRLLAVKNPEPTPQAVWERVLGLAGPAGLTEAARGDLLQQRAAAFANQPEEREYLRAWLDNLLEQKRWSDYDAGVARYAERFPGDRDELFQLRASLLDKRGQPGELVKYFRDNFYPLLGAGPVKAVFDRLQALKIWQPFLEETERQLRRDPLDLTAVELLYHIHVYKEDLNRAAGILRDYRVLKNARLGGPSAATTSPWTAEELAVLGILAGRASDGAEALRYFFAFYRDPAARTGADIAGLPARAVREEALKAAFDTMAREEGQADDYARESLRGWSTLVGADPDPGVAGGLLSLILNGQQAGPALDALEQSAGPYFLARRAEAVVAELKALVPPEEFLEFRARLAPFYARFGGEKTAWKLLEETAAAAVNPDFRRGALLRAAGYAESAENFTEAERLYRLAVAVEGEPPASALSRRAWQYWLSQPGQPPGSDRWQALDALTSYLAKKNRGLDVLAVYNGLLQARPDDERLYEKLAGVLESGPLVSQREELYRRALDRFDQPGWFNRLARFYINQKRLADFQTLSRRVVGAFQGSNLEDYLRQVLPEANGPLGKDAYKRFALEVYQAALERFPLNPVFLDNVVNYTRDLDLARYRRVLAAYCMLSDRVRDLYFQDLNGRGLLDGTIAAASAGDDPALLYLTAESRIWQCQYEDALPLYQRLAEIYPGDPRTVTRCASLLQSGAVTDPRRYDQAAELLAGLGERSGDEAQYRIQAGDCLAAGNRLAEAEVQWRKVLELYPGQEEKWHDIATVFWDYYRYADALRLLEEIRRRKNNPDLYPFEVGALEETLGRPADAMAEYLKIAVSWQDRSWDAQSRLERLLKREDKQQIFREMVARRLREVEKPVDFLAGVREFLNNWNLADSFPLPAWAAQLLAERKDPDVIRQALDRLGDLLPPAERIRGQQRLVELAPPGAERLAEVFTLVDKLRAEGREAEAAQLVRETVQSNPANLGVIRQGTQALREMKQPGPAMDVLRQALTTAVDPYRREFTEGLLDLLLQEKHPRELLPVAQAWTAGHPLDMAIRGKVWLALAALNDQAGLRQDSQGLIAQLPALEPDPARRKERLAEIRQQLIAAALAMGDKTLAVDNYLELLKDSPEDRPLLERVYVLADPAGLLPRVEDYCRKTMAASPSDYRWPLLLARLAMFKEEYAEAVDRYGQCLKVVPQRTDLAAELARPLENLGRLDALKQLYLDLAHLEFREPRWLRAAATIAWRQGRENELPERLRAYAEAVSGNPRDQSLARFDLAVEWHREGWAVDEALRLLDTEPLDTESINELAGRRLLVAAMRAGRFRQVLERVLDLYGQSLSGTDEDRIRALDQLASTGLIQVLNEGAPAEIRETILSALDTRLAGWLAGPKGDEISGAWERVAEKGVFRSQLTAIYQRRLARGSSASLPWEMREYLSNHGLWDEMAGLYQWLLDNNRELESYQRFEVMENLAWLAMIRNRPAEELDRLRAIYRYPWDISTDTQPSLRYYELLSRENKLGELGANLEGVTREREDLVDFLAGKKDFGRAAQAITKLFTGRKPVWRNTNLALLGTFAGNALPVDEPFRDVLHVVPIRDLIGWDADADRQLLPPDWNRFAALYGLWRLGPGQSAPEADLVPAQLERNDHRRQEYEETFERLLADGRLPQAGQYREWMTAIQSRPLADAFARLRLSVAAGEPAAIDRDYLALMEVVPRQEETVFISENGHFLLRLARSRSMLEKTAAGWKAIFLKNMSLGETGPVAALFLEFVYSLPAPARDAWLADFVDSHPRPAAAAEFCLRSGLATPANTVALARVVAAKLSDEEQLGREARLYLLGRQFGPGGAAAAVTPPAEATLKPPEGFLADGSLREQVISLTAPEWRSLENLLQNQAAAKAALTAGNCLQWAAGLADGAPRWGRLFAGLCREWGAPLEAVRIEKAVLTAGRDTRLLTAEEQFTLGGYEAELGDSDAMLQHFSTALDLADDRLGMARRITESLLERKLPLLTEPFLTALESLDQGGPEAAGLRLRRTLATDSKLVTPGQVLGYLNRPDAPLDRKAALIDVVVQAGFQNRPWAASIATELVGGTAGREWSEIRRLLALRLQALLTGVEAALPAAATDLDAHPEARLLAAWVVERAAWAKRADLVGRYLPILFRHRPDGDREMAPLWRFGAVGNLERQTLALLWPETLSYGNLNDRTGASMLELVADNCTSLLERSTANMEDLQSLQTLLEHLNLRGAMADVWVAALKWRLETRVKEDLTARILDLRDELRRQRQADGIRFRLVRESFE